MMTLTIVARVRSEKREEFLQAMRSFADQLEKQKGLKESALYQDVIDQTRFSLTHEWETREDLERYSGTEKFKILLGALELLCDESEIRCSHAYFLRDLPGYQKNKDIPSRKKKRVL